MAPLFLSHSSYPLQGGLRSKILGVGLAQSPTLRAWSMDQSCRPAGAGTELSVPDLPVRLERLWNLYLGEGRRAMQSTLRGQKSTPCPWGVVLQRGGEQVSPSHEGGDNAVEGTVPCGHMLPCRGLSVRLGCAHGCDQISD